jgi:hypothetical protein
MPAGAIIGAAAITAGSSIIAGSKAAKAQKKAAQQAASSATQADATNRYIFDTTRADYAPARAVGQGALYKLADLYGVPRPVASPSNGTQALPGDFSTMAGTDGVRGRFIDGIGFAPGGVAANFAAPAEQMTPGFDGFQASPGYQFRMQEALKAIERSAASRGSLRSGATLDALQRRAQGVAADEFDTYANRLAALAGVGQTANAGSAQAGQAYGASVNQTAGQLANAAYAAGNARASSYANTANAINSGVQNLTAAYLYNKGYGGFGGGGPVSTPGFGG